MSNNTIDYKKSEECGWEFTSKIDGDGLYVYYMGSGCYTTDPIHCDGCIEARYDICGGDFVGDMTFYCKEDAREYLSDHELYYVQEQNGYFKGEDYLSKRRSIISDLPTRKDALRDFTKNLDEEEMGCFNDLLKEYNNNLSLACSYFCSERGWPEEDCVLINYIPWVSFEKTSTEKNHNEPNNLFHTIETTSEFCNELNGLSNKDKLEWLKNMTKVENGEISVCGMKVERKPRSFRVKDDRGYWVSFAPNSSREHDVDFFNYLKGLTA